MNISFTQHIIGMKNGKKNADGSDNVSYLWFAEQALALPMLMQKPEEARLLESESVAKSYIRSFETMDKSYVGRLFIVYVSCQARLSGSVSGVSSPRMSKPWGYDAQFTKNARD